MRAPQFKQAALASQLAANVTDLDFIYVASSKQKQISAPSNRDTEPGRATRWVTLACWVHSVSPRGCQVFHSTTGCGKKNTSQITTSATTSKFKLEKRKPFSTQSTITWWSLLPPDVVVARGTSCFKRDNTSEQGRGSAG